MLQKMSSLGQLQPRRPRAQLCVNPCARGGTHLHEEGCQQLRQTRGVAPPETRHHEPRPFSFHSLQPKGKTIPRRRWDFIRVPILNRPFIGSLVLFVECSNGSRITLQSTVSVLTWNSRLPVPIMMMNRIHTGGIEDLMRAVQVNALAAASGKLCQAGKL